MTSGNVQGEMERNVFKRRMLVSALLLGSFLLVSIVIFEVTARIFIKPSNESYGALFHCELPPFKIKIGEKFHANYDRSINGIVVNGKKITAGDLWGMVDENPVLGYAPRENAVSVNGWWRSNNVGARASLRTTEKIPPGMKRMIVFGESFTRCSGVPQNETWPFFLNEKTKTLEVVNFGVDGYSMSQCMLRYESIKNKIDYDVVMLVFVPSCDLWRDVNVMRQLNGWQSLPLVPRYMLERNQLKLIASPYKTYADLLRENHNGTSSLLRDHLRKYDRFYFKSKYEAPSFVGDLIGYKLLASAFYKFQKNQLLRNAMEKNSEAMLVSQKIFKKMSDETRLAKKKFVLVFLPSSIKPYINNATFRRQYNEMITSNSEDGITCINLMNGFLKMGPDQFDAAYDGAHYGPRANKIISEILWEELKALKILS